MQIAQIENVIINILLGIFTLYAALECIGEPSTK